MDLIPDHQLEIIWGDLGWKKPRQRTAWVACGLGSAQPGPHVAWFARCLGCTRPGWKKPRQRIAQVAHDPGRALHGLLWCSKLFWFFFFFFFFSGFSLICFGFFSIFIRVVNRVLETRFPCGHHMEKYVTLDHIRLWKSSLKYLIYRPKSNLLYSKC